MFIRLSFITLNKKYDEVFKIYLQIQSNESLVIFVDGILLFHSLYRFCTKTLKKYLVYHLQIQ